MTQSPHTTFERFLAELAIEVLSKPADREEWAAAAEEHLAATNERELAAKWRASAQAASAPRQRKPRQPTMASVAKQANKAAITVARYEVKPDGTIVVVTGKPEPATPEDPWPLDEFRTKETKQ